MDEFFKNLIAALGLTPAEGQTEVTPEQALAKVNELAAAAGTAAETATTLATAQQELEQVRGQYQELFQREEEARKRVEEAAADEILAQYEARIATPEAKARLRALLLADREAAVEILKGLPEPAAKPPGAEPPAPVHNPDEEAGALTPEQKAAEAEKLIAELRKAKPAFKNYEDARNEIRRLRPELF